jgi:hypothetical protein
MVGSLKMNTTLEYSTRVVQEGDRRCKKSTLNDLAYMTPLRIPLMNPVSGWSVDWELESESKKSCQGTLRQEFISIPHFHAVYVYTVYCTYSHREGEGELNQKERLEGQQLQKSWSKIPTWYMTDCIPSPISDKYLPQSPFTGEYF